MNDKSFIIAVVAMCTIVFMGMYVLTNYEHNRLQFYKEVINQAIETNTSFVIN